MRVNKAGKPRDLLVETRVMLHRAGPEREEPKVDRVILTRQARVVTNRFGLAETGKTDLAVALEPPQVPGVRFEVREIDAGLIGRADLEQQGLFQHQRAIAGDGLCLALLVRRRGRPPA